MFAKTAPGKDRRRIFFLWANSFSITKNEEGCDIAQGTVRVRRNGRSILFRLDMAECIEHLKAQARCQLHTDTSHRRAKIASSCVTCIDAWGKGHLHQRLLMAKAMDAGMIA